MRVFIEIKNQRKLKIIKEVTGRSSQFTVNAIVDAFLSEGDPSEKLMELIKKNLTKYKIKQL